MNADNGLSLKYLLPNKEWSQKPVINLYKK